MRMDADEEIYGGLHCSVLLTKGRRIQRGGPHSDVPLCVLAHKRRLIVYSNVCIDIVTVTKRTMPDGGVLLARRYNTIQAEIIVKESLRISNLTSAPADRKYSLMKLTNRELEGTLGVVWDQKMMLLLMN